MPAAPLRRFPAGPDAEGAARTGGRKLPRMALTCGLGPLQNRFRIILNAFAPGSPLGRPRGISSDVMWLRSFSTATRVHCKTFRSTAPQEWTARQPAMRSYLDHNATSPLRPEAARGDGARAGAAGQSLLGPCRRAGRPCRPRGGAGRGRGPGRGHGQGRHLHQRRDRGEQRRPDARASAATAGRMRRFCSSARRSIRAC